MGRYWIEGIIVRGHEAASGQGGDPRYPQGTLAVQLPYFLERGLDLRSFYLGTLNLSLAPRRFIVHRASYTFRDVAWSPYIPPENFSFFDCRVLRPGGSEPGQSGLVYYPHPETKPEHFQDPHVLEIMTSFLNGVTYGDALLLELDDAQITVDGRP